jgi:hypothetical protein
MLEYFELRRHQRHQHAQKSSSRSDIMNSSTTCVSEMAEGSVQDWLPREKKPGRQRRQTVSLRPHGVMTVKSGGQGVHGTHAVAFGQ